MNFLYKKCTTAHPWKVLSFAQLELSERFFFLSWRWNVRLKEKLHERLAYYEKVLPRLGILGSD